MSDRREGADDATAPERMGAGSSPSERPRRVKADDLPRPETEEERTRGVLTREDPSLAGRDRVETQGGDVRPQRSTEEHGAGHVEEPGVNIGLQRTGGAGPDYPESHSEPPAHPARHPGGDTESAGHAEGHGEPRLGPIDVRAWGASLLGVLAGAGVAFLFYLATT